MNDNSKKIVEFFKIHEPCDGEYSIMLNKLYFLLDIKQTERELTIRTRLIDHLLGHTIMGLPTTHKLERINMKQKFADASNTLFSKTFKQILT